MPLLGCHPPKDEAVSVDEVRIFTDFRWSNNADQECYIYEAAPGASPVPPPILTPTEAPVPSSTQAPTLAPIRIIGEFPSPTDPPTREPLATAPTDVPVATPTDAPFLAPTDAPVPSPTKPPVFAPTDVPLPAPTDAPTSQPVASATTEQPVAVVTGEPPLPTSSTQSPLGLIVGLVLVMANICTLF